MEFDKGTFPLCIGQSKRVYSKALHHTVGTRNSSVAHGPHIHVSCLGMHVNEIPKVVMGALCLGYLIMRLWLPSMDHIGEFKGVIDEEHWYVVADNVPIALIRVHFYREASYVSDRICAASAAEYCGEANKDGGLPGGVGQNTGIRDICS